ncbi:MAG: Lrp/AsnC family transcriptional regulator [Candidatus Hodarchaeota archaeon]
MKDNGIEELDLNILGILCEDGRKSHRSIGAKLEKSHLTIKKHVDDLEDKGIIKGYSANIDFEKLGYEIISIIELTISKGKMLEVENKIAKNPNIFAVYDITGEYDALILARFKNRRDLSKMIKEIHTSPYVERTNTHLVLNVIKEASSFIGLIEKENEKK